MTVGAERQWRRSAYPLQDSSKSSARPSPASLPSSPGAKKQNTPLRHAEQAVRSAQVSRSTFQPAKYPAQQHYPASPPESNVNQYSTHQLSQVNLQAQEKLNGAGAASTSSSPSSPSSSDHLAGSSYTDNLWSSLHFTGSKGGRSIPAPGSSITHDDSAQQQDSARASYQRSVQLPASLSASPTQNREYSPRQSRQYSPSPPERSSRSVPHSRQMSNSSSTASHVSLSLFNQIQAEPVPARALETYPTQAKPAQIESKGTRDTRPDSTKTEPGQAGVNEKSTAMEQRRWSRSGYPLHHTPSLTFNQSASSSPHKEATGIVIDRSGEGTGRPGGTPAGDPMHKPGNSSPNSSQNSQPAKSPWTRQKYPLHSSEMIPPPPADPSLEARAERSHRGLGPAEQASVRHSDRVKSKQDSSQQSPKKERKGNEHKVLIPKHIQARSSEKTKTEGRTIIICLDGTGDKFDSDNSNIVHLISALKKDDARQVTYYQAGIGTYGSAGLSSGVTAAMDMAVGSGLGLHVRDAYHFLMHSYKEGDKICIFGFSRGAYTARCLAGMVHKVGLLPPRNLQQIAFAYDFYKQDTPEGWRQSQDFKKTFSIDVSVYFLGCFDSVASVGFIPRQLPLSTTPLSKPRYFRHAMALDERRAKFKVCRHQTKDWDDIEEASPAKGKQKHVHHDMPSDDYDDIEGEHDEVVETDVLEVWFAGAHADVGGGAVPNTERHKLAHIPLRWMIRQAFECDTGILFKTKVLAEFGLDVHTLWPKYQALGLPASEPPASFLEKYEKELPERAIRRGKLVPVDEYHEDEPLYHLKSHTDEDWTPEQVEDFYDAIAPLNDQLIQAPTWWILEMWPVEYKVPVKPGKSVTRFGMNLGQYRGIEDERPNLHWTVQRRMRHLGYKIAARVATGTNWRSVV